MKSIFKSALFTLVILFLNMTDVSSCQTKSYLNDSKTLYTQPNPTTHEQTKAQVGLFRNALDKFGANSPEEVINIWANAEKSKNGVFHYAVACDELKDKLIKEWGEPTESYWIYGTSSPWLDKYEILYNIKLSNSEYQAKIKFFWVTSSGPSEPTETTLVIIKDKDRWCVKEAKIQ